MRPAAGRLVLTALAVAAVGCGAPPATEVLGTGAEAVTIRRPAERSGATVLFLHGWGATRPRAYGPWIEHLLAHGHVVVYPRYQESFASLPGTALAGALKGIRAAFDRLGDVRPLVVVGHSAGGALAADYAAVAATARLPPPAAIMLAYPGRTARGMPGRLPELGDERIPRSVRVLAVASEGDAVVGAATARAVVRAAGHGRLVLVRRAGARDHLAPQRADGAARRVFWRRLDRLVRDALR